MIATVTKSYKASFLSEPKIQIMLVLLIAFLARTLCVIFFGDTDITNATVFDGKNGTKIWEYGTFAINYIKTGTISRNFSASGVDFLAPTAYMPPGPVFLWIGLFKIFGVTSNALTGMLVINILTGVFLVYLTYQFALETTDDHSISLTTALIVALYPTFVFSAATYHVIGTYMVLLLLFMILLCRFLRKPSYQLALFIGLLGGLNALWRVEFGFFAGVLLIAALFINRNLKLFFTSIIVMVIVILPWTVRNYIVLDKFVLIAQSTGYNLFKGFNPLASGSGDHVEKIGAAKILLGDQLANVPSFDKNIEAIRDQIFKSYAVKFMKEEPIQAFLVLPLKKLFLYWFMDIYDPDVTLRKEYLLAFIPIFILTIAGLILTYPGWKKPEYIMIFTLFAAQSFVTCFYAVHARYRMSMEPFLFIFAGYAIVWLIRRISIHNLLSHD